MEKPFAQARGFFIYVEIRGGPPEQGIPHATKLPGAVWNGAAGPEGGGQEARNNVVHRLADKRFCCLLIAQIQNQSNPLAKCLQKNAKNKKGHSYSGLSACFL